MLSADKVLVTIGTPVTMSAVGSTETYFAKARGTADYVLAAAFDAGLVDLGLANDGSLGATWRGGGEATIADVEQRFGRQLRDGSGIRIVDELLAAGNDVATDVAAGLTDSLVNGGLRELAGLRFADVRSSDLRDMHSLFDDDPRLGPSLQAQLFAYAGIGALASLPIELRRLLPDPYDFRVAAASAFPGLDSLETLRSPAAGPSDLPLGQDKFAARLSSSLSTHGPALVSTMLAPSYPLSKSMKQPWRLESLRGDGGYMRVPQAPMNSGGACASSFITLCELAPQMLLDYPGFRPPKLALWTAADAATRFGWRVLEGFGPAAMMTSAKLAALNEGRDPADRRSLADSLAPFDADANGTVVGDGGSGVLVTTLDFALRNFLDITSIIVGWGQSGEAGGKAHFAGVGFGGENALIHTFEMALKGHGMGVADFHYLVAHGTGTRANSKTDLSTVASARSIAATRAGYTGALPRLAVGSTKALGDGHSMGETGLKAVSQALEYVLGKPAVGIPTFRNLDPSLEHLTESFDITAGLVQGDTDGRAICATQGFGGYNGALALRGANADSIARYDVDQRVLDPYLERWPQVRAEREQRERLSRITRGSTLELAQFHRWQSPD